MHGLVLPLSIFGKFEELRRCLEDISEVHPSIKGGDIWPKMRSMKQQDCMIGM